VPLIGGSSCTDEQGVVVAEGALTGLGVGAAVVLAVPVVVVVVVVAGVAMVAMVAMVAGVAGVAGVARVAVAGVAAGTVMAGKVPAMTDDPSPVDSAVSKSRIRV
jgi:hypothetical protein